MSSNGRNAQDADKVRVPVQAKVNFVVQDFAGFISEYSSNISKGGMFVASSAPKPEYTSIDFEFRLSDDFPLIRGQGVVVWCREHDEGPSRPAGMGIRFTYLDEPSRELIDRIVTSYVEEGGTPFDLDDTWSVSGARAGDSRGAATPPAGPVPEPQPVPVAEPAEPEPSVPPSTAEDDAEISVQSASVQEPATSEATDPGLFAPPPRLQEPDPRRLEDTAVVERPAQHRVSPPGEALSQPGSEAISREQAQSVDSGDLPPQQPPHVATTAAPPEPQTPAASDDSGPPSLPDIDLTANLDAEVESEAAFSIALPPRPAQVPGLADGDMGKRPSSSDRALEPDLNLGSGLTPEVEAKLASEAPDLEDLDGALERQTGADSELDTGPTSVLPESAEEMPEFALGVDLDPTLEPSLLLDESEGRGPEDLGGADSELDTSPPSVLAESAGKIQRVEANGDLEPTLEPSPLLDETEGEALEYLEGETPVPPLTEMLSVLDRVEDTPSRDHLSEPLGAGAEDSGELLSPLGDLEELAADSQPEETTERLADSLLESPTPIEQDAGLEDTLASAIKGPHAQRRARRRRARGLGLLSILILLAIGGYQFRDEIRSLQIVDDLLTLIRPVPYTEPQEATYLPESAAAEGQRAISFLELMESGSRMPEIKITEPRRRLQPMTAIDNISWETEAEETVITVWANGGIGPTSCEYLRFDGEPPREILKMRGVAEPYSIAELMVGSDHLTRIRVGYHPRQPFNELHLVLDLAAAGMRLRSAAIEGTRLELRVGRDRGR